MKNDPPPVAYLDDRYPPRVMSPYVASVMLSHRLHHLLSQSMWPVGCTLPDTGIHCCTRTVPTRRDNHLHIQLRVLSVFALALSSLPSPLLFHYQVLPRRQVAIIEHLCRTTDFTCGVWDTRQVSDVFNCSAVCH